MTHKRTACSVRTTKSNSPVSGARTEPFQRIENSRGSVSIRQQDSARLPISQLHENCRRHRPAPGCAAAQPGGPVRRGLPGSVPARPQNRKHHAHTKRRPGPGPPSAIPDHPRAWFSESRRRVGRPSGPLRVGVSLSQSLVPPNPKRQRGNELTSLLALRVRGIGNCRLSIVNSRYSCNGDLLGGHLYPNRSFMRPLPCHRPTPTPCRCGP